MIAWCGVDYDTALSGGLGATIVAVVWAIAARIGRWATRQRWTHTIETTDTALIAKERDELRVKVHEHELRTSAAEAKAAHCRDHAAKAIEERDRLARKIAGLEGESDANIDHN